jgi:hypothetical protein
MIGNCKNCGRELFKSKSDGQCIYCGHRPVPVSEQFLDRVQQFAVTNLVVWAGVAVNTSDVAVNIGLVTAATTFTYLFGGFALRQVFRGAGEWLAMAGALVMAVGLFDWAVR